MKIISVKEAKEELDKRGAIFVDLRDPVYYQDDHIPGAIHVNDENVGAFMATADKTRTHIIYCYHGNNSQGGAAYFEENGFEDVYSMAGGFSAW
ncbi:MAG: rhodanese-like domain-containing protein [Candidatus Latescibacteria bacterium]|jgi:thiosulfate sulfurtransferase|nr:rhodanese-like domain-containing protein [Candidatus Latescibacterota bacterium]MDP7239348.1 rhodanese-like domain-containing protein [Candidatus Latescibacterota bacterium]